MLEYRVIGAVCHPGTLFGGALVNVIFSAIDIPTMDLSSVIEQLKHQPQYRDWPHERMEVAVREYRRFLALCKAYSDVSLIPGRDVDSVWHRHILNTKKYASDCQEYFGYFLHHNPHSRIETGTKAPNQAWQTTLQLYEELFGEKPPAGWLNGQSICNGGCDGTKCSPEA